MSIQGDLHMDLLVNYILPGIQNLALHDSVYQQLLCALEQERGNFDSVIETLPASAKFAVEDYIDAYTKLILRSLLHAYHLGQLQSEIESPDGRIK